MSTAGHYIQYPKMPLQMSIPVVEVHWYAVQTRSRHERVVAAQLREQGVNDIFLPLITKVQRWSDRRKLVEFPLFSGYLFVHAAVSPLIRKAVLFTRGVAGFISMRGEPLPIPDEQIDNIRELLAKNIRCASHPFLKVGQRVRIRGGSLEGIEGILVGNNGDRKLVVSVDAIERAFSIHLDGYDVEII